MTASDRLKAMKTSEAWRGAAVTLVFVALWVFDPFASLTPSSQIEPERVVFFPLLYGLALGRWWGIAAALLPVALVAPSGEDAGVTLVWLAPWQALSILIGVALHKLIAWGIVRLRPSPRASVGKHADGSG